jgi:hypothetical protein
MKSQPLHIVFGYFKQFLLMAGLIYTFSNCQVKKSVLHFAGMGTIELSQKSLTQLPVQGSCSVSLLQKNKVSKKHLTILQIPVLPKLKSFHFETKKSLVFKTLQIHPAFEFEKSSASYPPIFIQFKNLKIASRVVSYSA